MSRIRSFAPEAWAADHLPPPPLPPPQDNFQCKLLNPGSFVWRRHMAALVTLLVSITSKQITLTPNKVLLAYFPNRGDGGLQIHMLMRIHLFF